MKELWDKPENLRALVDEILVEAKRVGCTAAEVDIGLHKGFSVSVHDQDVESIEYHQDKVADINVYIGQRSGSASLTDLSFDSIKSAVKAAHDLAQYSDEDDCAGLADKNELAFDYPDLDLAYPWDVSVDDAIAIGKACEKTALAYDKRIIKSESVSLVTSSSWYVYANSHGFTGIYPATRHELSCLLIAQQDDDMERDHYYTTSCDPTLLIPSETVATFAAKRVIQRLGAQRLSTRRVPVIFIAEEARGLLGHFIAAIAGSSIYRKSSFLVDHLGEQVFPNHISLHEEPHLPKSLGSAPFDDDGVRTRPNVFVKDGQLTSYVMGTYSARKLNLKSTGNAGGVHNLFITKGNNDLAGLLKKMGTGLLITELMGQGINLTTGDYSRGAAGFWVENGEIQYPVHEITIAGNLKEMYANLVEVGTDVDTRGNIRTGSILLDHMTVAGH